MQKLDWALEAVDVATKGMERIEKKMKEKLAELQSEVKKWMIGEIVMGVFSVLTSVASMAVNPFGAVGLADKVGDLKKLETIEKAGTTINVHSMLCYDMLCYCML